MRSRNAEGQGVGAVVVERFWVDDIALVCSCDRLEEVAEKARVNARVILTRFLTRFLAFPCRDEEARAPGNGGAAEDSEDRGLSGAPGRGGCGRF